MILEPNPTPEPDEGIDQPRLFLHEPGWRVALKAGSEREFCYAAWPGQNYYHRLLDGEVYLYRGDERLCLPCAARRGLLSFEPRQLRETVITIEDIDLPAGSSE